MSDYPNERDCEHGALRRSCEVCELKERMVRAREAMLRIAIECNCRAEHGADGAAHLLTIERMIRNAVDGLE